MPDESVLREKAREAVRAGKLPTRKPDRTWGGPGAGEKCGVCGERVTKDQMEFEVQFQKDGPGSGFYVFNIHIRCFAAWEFERRGDGAAPHT